MNCPLPDDSLVKYLLICTVTLYNLFCMQFRKKDEYLTHTVHTPTSLKQTNKLLFIVLAQIVKMFCTPTVSIPCYLSRVAELE